MSDSIEAMNALRDQLKAAVTAREIVHATGTDGAEFSPAMSVAYRNVFIEDPQGQAVLADLLKLLKFSEKGSDMFHLAMRNVGLEILTRCGIEEDNLVDILIKGL